MAWYNNKGEKAPNSVLFERNGKQVYRSNPGADPVWREANGYIYDHDPRPAPEPEPKTVFTKLAIRRAMRALGMEAQLDAILAGNATFARDWADAQEIDLADPVLVQALAAAQITEAEIEAIRRVIENGGVPPTPPPEPTPEVEA